VISSVAGSNFNDCPHRAQSRIVGGSLPKFNLGKLTLKIFNSLQLLAQLSWSGSCHQAALQTDDRIVYYCSPFNPTPTAPVSSAFVFAPDVALVPSPTPIVWTNDNASFTGIFIPSLRVPTNIAPARNCCRNARGRQR
jgi:hypothetical protein